MILRLLLGANYVQAESKGTSYGADTIYDENKVLPYAGITYNFTPEYTGYIIIAQFSAHKRLKL